MNFLDQLKSDVAATKQAVEKELKAIDKKIGPAEAELLAAEKELAHEEEKLANLRTDFTATEELLNQERLKEFAAHKGMLAEYADGKIPSLDFQKMGITRTELLENTKRKVASELSELLDAVRGKDLNCKRLRLRVKRCQQNILLLNSSPRTLEIKLLQDRIRIIETEQSSMGSIEALSTEANQLELEITQGQAKAVAWGRSWYDVTPEAALELRFDSLIPDYLFPDLQELHDVMLENNISVLESPLLLRPSRSGGKAELAYFVAQKRKSLHVGDQP